MLIFTAALLVAQGRIVFDTDPGRFTDDNVALIMCLRSPERVKLEGITIVSGNVWAQDGQPNIRRTLRLLKNPELTKSIPVHLGAQRPLRHTPAMSRQQGPLEFAGAFGLPEPPPRRETAVEFLRATLARSPGEVTILALGPLTNLAQLLTRHPESADQIKRLVIMGGNVEVPGNATKAAEFNFWFDPEAARLVLRSRIREKVLVGLDACNQAVLTRADFDAIVAANTAVTREFRLSFGFGYPGFLKNPAAQGYLWDELAAGYLIDPGVLTRLESRGLDVVTEWGPRYGAIVPAAEMVPPVRVAFGVDAPRAKRLHRELLTRR
jgi:inosine-uridine nucleoside N-ribohydrolase